MRQTRTTTRTLGIELEGWAFTHREGKCVPVDVGPTLPKFTEANGVPVTGNVYRESGIGSIELAGEPADTVRAAVDNILQLHRRTNEEGLKITFTCASPYDGPLHSNTLETQKSRFLAIMEAAQLETARIGAGPDDWKYLLKQNLYAATHLHAAFPGMRIAADHVDYRLIFATNVLNNIGPRVAKIICRKHKIDNTGHLGIFSKWAAPARFPDYNLWFRSFDDLRRQIGTIPRFICCESGDKEHGRWKADLKTPMEWGDHDVAELGSWHLCRLRTSHGTIEVRILPSVPLEHLASAIGDLDEILTFLVSIAGPDDCDCDGFAEFMTKPIWSEIAAFPIGGQETLPPVYTREMWLADFFG